MLVAGCHPGDCHYADGNFHAQRRYALMHRFLDYMGIEAERLRVDWVSAAEGARFAEVVRELTEAFGWSALVEPRRMTTSARCTRDVDIIAINGDDLKALLEDHPGVGMIVMENVAKIVRGRLMHTRQRLIAERGLEALYESHRAY